MNRTTASSTVPALLLLTALGLPTARALAGPEGKDVRCVALAVDSTPTTPVGKRPPKLPVFSSTEVLGLDFTVLLEKKAVFDKESIFRLRLLTPKGKLYQEIAIPVTTPDDRETRKPIADYPRPVTAAKVKETSWNDEKYPSITFPVVPVAGTLIMSSSLYGVWTAEVWTEGGEKPCQRTEFLLDDR